MENERPYEGNRKLSPVYTDRKISTEGVGDAVGTVKNIRFSPRSFYIDQHGNLHESRQEMVDANKGYR